MVPGPQRRDPIVSFLLNVNNSSADQHSLHVTGKVHGSQLIEQMLTRGVNVVGAAAGSFDTPLTHRLWQLLSSTGRALVLDPVP